MILDFFKSLFSHKSKPREFYDPSEHDIEEEMEKYQNMIERGELEELSHYRLGKIYQHKKQLKTGN